MVSRAQKISTVVDILSAVVYGVVSRAQKISTVVDTPYVTGMSSVSRAQKISTVVDKGIEMFDAKFHALKKFLLL